MKGARGAGLRWLFGLLLLFLFLSTSVLAQLPTGTILGTVKDSTGGAVAGANVTVTNTDTGVSRTGPTQDDGSYRFPALAVGNYSITVTKDGFQTTQRTGLTLTVGQEAAIDITLQVGSTTQSVVVTGEAPLVDTTSSTVGALVNDQQVADLPLNGRNLVNLTLMEPGIAQTTVIPATTIGAAFMTGVTFSSDGAPIHSNNYMLDGADMMSVFGLNDSSIIGTTLGVDGVKEYKVVTNLPDATYGLSMGSETTIVSKGGSNQFHGDVFDYLRNSSMDARNYFDALDKLDFNGDGTDKSLDFAGKRIPPFRRNNFGASVGGPIRKDKTFFYAVYEGVRARTGATITTTTLPYNCFTTATPHVVTSATLLSCAGLPASTPVNSSSLFLLTAPLFPGQAGLFPYPNANINPNGSEETGATYDYSFPYIEPTDEDYGQIRLDENFSNSDSFFGRYTQDDARETASRAYAYQRDYLFGGEQFTTLSETHIFSPTVLNTARFSFSRNNNYGVSTTSPLPPTSMLLQPGQPEPGGVTPDGSSVTALGFLAADGQYVNNIYTYSDDVFWTKGKHAFKFGFLLNNFHVPENGHFESQGTVSFTTLANFAQGIYSGMTALGGSLSPSQYRYFGYKTVGFYAQDDVRATARLTLNLGLRYEFNTMPTNLKGTDYQIQDVATANGASATQGAVESQLWQNNPSLHAISPRIGFAFDPTGSGKTAIRGGAGIYYDIGNFGALLFQQACCEPPLDYFNTINNSLSSIAAMNAAGLPTFQVPLPIAYGSAPVTSSNPNGVVSTLQGIASPRNWSYHWNQPSIYQWNLTIDRQLPGSQSITVGYVGSRGIHLVELEEGNPTSILGYLSNGLPYYCHPPGSSGPPTPTDQCSATSPFPPKSNPTYGIVNQDSAGSESWYNGLQVNYTKRLGHGLQGQIAYTWSKLLDTGQGQQGAEAGVAEATYFPQVQFLDKGPAGFNVPQNVRGNLIYHAPDFRKDSGITGKALSGWWVGTIVSLQSGYPFNPLIGNRSLSDNPSGAGTASDRPSLDSSFNYSTVITNNPSNWFNETMYDLPLAGTLGNAPRYGLRGPNMKDVDLSLNKDTKAGFLGEAGSVEFRAEFFNIFNRPNFSNPNATINSLSSPANPQCGPGYADTTCQFGVAGGPTVSGTAGQVTSTVTTSRQIQLSLRMIF